MIRRLTNNWLPKLVSLLLAIVSWYVVSISDTSVSQRSLRVPVTIEGLSENQTQSGAPAVVDVIISGRSSSVNALRPENFRASLNLSNIVGEYQQQVVVVPPQDISLVSVSPEAAIGTVETISTKDVPVSVALEGNRNINTLLTSVSSVQNVRATGRESVLAQVASATAFVSTSEGESSATLFATGVNGQPINEITLEPAATTITVTSTPILHTKTVTLEIMEPDTSFNVESFSVSQTTLQIAGPREQLAVLETVVGLIVLPKDSEAREYNLPVQPQLPEGVRPLEPVSATFRLSRAEAVGSTDNTSGADDAQ
ncbi:MAG: CdaR family protein [Trueperaceae bacterium]